MSRVRNLVRLIHLYMGLSLGLLFAITGLTGGYLVFYPQLDDWAHHAVHAAASTDRPESYESLYQALLKAHPERSPHWRIEIPEHGGPIQARSLSEADLAGTQFAPLIVWMDPRDNQVLRDAQWGHFLSTWIYDLHYRLLAGPTGSTVMGVVGLTVVVMLITGVWAWCPSAWRAVAAALRYRRHASRNQQLYDLHKLVGLSGAMFLLVIAVTGAMISLPGPTAALLSPLSAPYAAPSLASRPLPDLPRLSIDRALASASASAPGGTLKWIDTPGVPTGVYAFRYRLPGEPGIRFPNSVVWVEQYSGQVLGLRDATRDPAATAVVDWAHPLHTGEALGLAGKWLALLVGLLPATLFVTGVWRWLIRK